MDALPIAFALTAGKSLLFVVAAILPILNPAATAPIFLTLTEGADAATRAHLARRIAINVFIMVLAAMLIGSYVLEFFGISLPIVQVGGGLIVAANAWRLLNATDASNDNRNRLAQAFTPEIARRQAFYPMTFPLTCGPGTIAASITVGVSLVEPSVGVTIANLVGSVIGVAAITLMTYLGFRYAQKLLKPLGESGTVVFLRLSAFILLCLGVQIMWNGLSELLRSVLSSV